MTVNDALGAAREMLHKPQCGRLFDEFRDARGNPLSSNLIAAGESPVERLERLYFTEADPLRCNRDPGVMAYTSPGSRVVWICADQFAERFAMAVRPGAVLLIHELLHSSGLGENPPTSAEITAAVARRCQP